MDVDVACTPPEMMRIMRARHHQVREEVKRDQMWYELGRNFEYVERMLREFAREVSKTKEPRHEWARGKINEALDGLQTLNRRITGKQDELVDFYSVLREWNRLFDLIQDTKQKYKAGSM